MAKQIEQSSAQRDPLTCPGGVEEDWSRCGARFSFGIDLLALNRHTAKYSDGPAGVFEVAYVDFRSIP